MDELTAEPSAEPTGHSPASSEAAALTADEQIFPPQVGESTPAKWPSGAARGVQEVRYTHDAMINAIIVDPSVSQNALAAAFGYSPAWVSQIIASDAFQARLAERTGELVDPTIRATVENRFKALVLRSMEILQEKLNRPSSQIPDQLALRALEVGARAAGFGARQSTTQVQVNVSQHIEAMGDNLTQLLRRRRAEAIEHLPSTLENAP